ncbi:hypothetical protein C8J57DRAFT_418438 [Mycena rebaudengoi]|nr:hypothetical protein C8J57DRAFT_418438 [Mycena rebaudengoi]
MTTTISCSECGGDLGRQQEVMQTTSSEAARRLHLRSRLSYLNTLIAALTIERQSLQAESDSIMYPVLSLPTEITMEIFRRCVPSGSPSRPSPSTAPLLLTQICRQWRKISLDTPHLWCSLAFGDDSSVEILKLWLLRAGSLPLDYSFHCGNPSQASSVIEISILHSHRWQNVSFKLPIACFSTLDMRHHSFPILRKISLDIHDKRSYRDQLPDAVIVQNSPSLREVHISTFPEVKFDIPWNQLTTLVISYNVQLMDCISTLRDIPGLVHLVAHIAPTTTTPIPIASPLTLNHLESLTSSISLLEHLTLPRLERLTVKEFVTGQQTTFQPFISRSACVNLIYLSLHMTPVPARALLACLRVTPSVEELELRWGGPQPGELFTLLQKESILPRLTSLRFHGARMFVGDYSNLLATLRARRAPFEPASDRTVLDSLTLELGLYSNHLYEPRTSTLFQLRAFAADGMRIKLTMSGNSSSSTRVVFDSGAV